jgi:hypothetical protein
MKSPQAVIHPVIRDVAVHVALAGGPVRGGAQDAKRVCLTGGAAPISCGKRSEGKDRCGLQRGSGPSGTRWPSRSCPASQTSGRILCMLSGMSNSTWETTSPPPVCKAMRPRRHRELRGALPQSQESGDPPLPRNWSGKGASAFTPEIDAVQPALGCGTV